MFKDFEIIIGANTGIMESDIVSALKDIGRAYPIQVQAVLANDSEIYNQLDGIANKLKALGSIHIGFDKSSPLGNLDSDLSSASKKAEQMASKLTDGFKDVSTSAKTATTEAERLLKVTQKLDAEGKKVTKSTVVSGGDYYTQKVTKNQGEDGDKVDLEQSFDFKKLNKYVNSINDDLKKWGSTLDNSGEKTERIKAILSEILTKYKLDPKPDGAFEKDLEELKELHGQLKETEGVQEKLAKARIEWEEKINKLKKDGYTHNKQMSSLDNKLNNLHNGQFDDLNSVNKALEEMNEQYKRALKYADDLKEKIRINNVVKGANDKLSNIDTSLLTDDSRKDYDKMQNQIGKLKTSESKFEESKSLEKIDELYGKLLASQKAVVEQRKLEAKQAKEMEAVYKSLEAIQRKTVEEQNKLQQQMIDQQIKAQQEKIKAQEEEQNLRIKQAKEMEAVYESLAKIERKNAEEQNKLKQQMIDQQVKENNRQQRVSSEKTSFDDIKNQLSQNAEFDPSDFKELDKMINSLSANSETLEDDLKAVHNELKRIGELHKQIGLDREKINENLVKLEREQQEEERRRINETLNARAEAEQKRIDATEKENERQSKNQTRITEETARLNEELAEISGRELFDNADLEKARQMISGLSKESETLESDLRAIRDELKNVNKEINNRQTRQSDTNKVINKQNANADKLEADGILPEDMVREFRNLVGAISMDSLEEDAEVVANEFRKLVELQEALKNELKESERYERLLVEARQQMVKTVDVHENRLEQLNYNLRQQLGDTQNIEQVQGMINRLTEQLTGIRRDNVRLTDEENNNIREQLQLIQRTTTELRGVEREISQIERQTQSLDEKLQNARYRALRGLNDSNRAFRQMSAEFDEIETRRQNLLTIDTSTDIGRNQYREEYAEIERMMADANREASRLRDQIYEDRNSMFGRLSHAFKQVPIYMSAMGVFYGLTNQLTQGFQSVLDIDKAMTNLMKVTDATNAELKEFKNTASDIGSELGVLTADIINSTAEFQKLGYSLTQATALAQNTILYANVGDMNIDDATSYMVSTIKGFNVEVDKSGKSVQKIIDIFNAVSNNYAISAEGIGQALQRSSAVLTQAGNSIEQSVALITSANTTIQDPMKVGNALKTISMRLRGVDEEGKQVVNLVPELEKTFNRFGATIMENESTFKSTYDIMDELKRNWGKLTDIEQANITELIGGKEQGSIVASMIANWNDALGSYETALDSAGSAQREFEKYTQSFEYKINSLKVALEELWVTVMDDTTMKNLIDTLTFGIHVLTGFVDVAGIIPSVIGLATVSFLTMSKTMRQSVLETGQLSTAWEVLGTNLERGNRSLRGSSGAFLSFAGTLAKTAGKLIAITAVIMLITSAITGVIDFFYKSNAERADELARLDDEIMKYKELKSTLEGFSVAEFDNLRLGFENGTLNEEDMQKYLDMKDKIVSEMPELIQSFNENGEAVIKTKEKVEELLDAKERLYNHNLKEKAMLSLEDMDTGDLERQINKTRELIQNVDNSNEEEQVYVFVESWIKANADAIEKGGEELEDKMRELYDGANAILSDDNMMRQDVLDKLTFMQMDIKSGKENEVLDSLDELRDNIAIRSANLASEVEDSKIKLSNEMVGFNSALDDMINATLNDMDITKNSNEYLFVKQMRESITEDIYALTKDHELEEIVESTPQWIAEMLENAESADVDINKLFNANLNGDELKKEYDKFIKSVDSSTSEGKLFIQMLKEMRKEATTASSEVASIQIDPFSTLQNQAIPAMNAYLANVRDLDDAYRKLAEGQSLTNDEILKLVASNPQLNKSLTIQNGHLKLNKEALQAVAKEHQNAFKAQLESAKKSVTTSQEKAKANIHAIFAEVTALKVLSSANREQAREAMLADEGVRNHASPTALTHMERQINQYYDYVDEINSLQSILDSLNTGGLSLGSSALDTSSSSDKAKDKAKETKKELQDAIYIADKYALSMERINTLIALQQSKRERMTSHSNEYRKSLQEEIKLTNEKANAINAEIKSVEKQIATKKIEQKGLIQINKDGDNKTARARQAEIDQQVDELRGTLYSLKEERDSIMTETYNLRWQSIESTSSMYSILREQYTDDISYQEYMMNLYDKNSDGYKKNAKEKIRLMQIQQDYWQKELNYLEEQKKSNKNLLPTDIENINEKIREAREGLYSINSDIMSDTQGLHEIDIEFKFDAFNKGLDEFDDSIKQVEDSIKNMDKDDWSGILSAQENVSATYRGQIGYIKEVVSELNKMKQEYGGNHELVKMINEEILKWEDALDDSQKALDNSLSEVKKKYEEIADEIVEIYKDGIEKQIEAEEEMYEELMAKAEDAHNTKMKQYERELDILSDIYDKQIEMINREDATRTHENTLDKLREEAKSLQKQMDILSLDDSYESISKRKDLSEELSKKNEEIDELQYQREKDLRIQSLEDAKKTEEDKLNDKMDLAEEEYNNFVKRKEKEHEANMKHLEDMLEDEIYFAELRKGVMNQHLTETASLMESWKNNVGDYVSVLGDTVVNNFTKKITDAVKEFEKMDKITKNQTNSVTNTKKEISDATSSINQIKNTGSLNSSSGNKGSTSSSTSGGSSASSSSTGSSTSSSTTSGSSSGSSSKSETKFSTTKIVKAKVVCWLYADANKSKKLRQLDKNSQWKAYGEINGLYNLGGGYSEKSNFTEVGATSNNSSSGSGGSRYHTVSSGDTMSHLAEKYYGSANQWSKIQKANPSINPNKMQIGTKLLIPFRTGGYTGDWSGDEGRLAILHKKEQVLDANQTQDIFNTVKTLENLKRMNVNNNINIEREKREQPIQQITNEYNLTLEIENMNGDKKTADIVSDQIMQNIKRTKGGRR